ncbi:MAG: LysR family transcriptional regulator [Burkholderiales bacterium]|nr:LysR family transcriptional regulator [Burkholderiales bacterium]
MLTLKQIQAVYWVHVLGSYHAAAHHLHATQSAVSKRILELEESLNLKLFEPSNRTQLTRQGRDILGDLERILQLHRNVLQRVSDDKMYAGSFRLGVSEMVAVTWLPDLLTEIERRFPRLSLESSVSLTSVLWSQMSNQRLDMIICPHIESEEAQFLTKALGEMRTCWMAKPGLLTIPDRQGRYTLQHLQGQTLLTHSGGSQLHQQLQQSLERASVRFDKVIYCNSMIALAELAVAGLGLTCLPRDYFDAYVRQGHLQVLKCDVPPPSLPYQAIYRNDLISERIAEMACRKCRFIHPRAMNRSRPRPSR